MKKINAVLLAGGESSRFGSDKALIPFAGMTLIEYIYHKLKRNFAEVIIIAPQKRYSFIKGAEIKEDLYQDKGPLAGIYTGLLYSEAEYNFICGCDMPFLTSSYFDFLKEILLKNHSKEIIVPEHGAYFEPLAALYNKSLLAAVRANIKADNLRLKSFYQQSSLKIIKEEVLKKKFNLERLFFNLNYYQDYEQALSYLKKGEDKIVNK